jgi:hypothetical protein
MIIIQRRDVFTGLWVDTVIRHSIWNARRTARRNCRRSGHDYRVVAAQSGAVLETALADELGLCCPINGKVTKRPHYGLEPWT